MDYVKKVYENYPSTDTPIDADSLNNSENGIKKANQKTTYNSLIQDSAGKVKFTLEGTLSSGDIIPVIFPTLATSTTMQLSVDGGTTYYYIKNMSSDSVFNDFSDTELTGGKAVLYYDGTYFILDKSKYNGKIVTNLNTITKNNDYTCYSTATGAPNSNYSWFVKHSNSNAGTASAHQIAVAYSTNLIVYERVMQNGVWGNWSPITQGWIALPTLTYSSTDNPTGVVTAVGNLTSYLGVGMRLMFINNSNTIYGIITAISYSSGTTTITFLHEINTSTGNTAKNLMVSGAITNAFYSNIKSPFGFPSSPNSWTVVFTDTTQRITNNVAASTWYNMLNYTLPKGLWNTSIQCYQYVNRGNTGYIDMASTLSTSPSAETDKSFTSTVAGYASSGYGAIGATCFRNKILDLSVKTTYYVNIRSFNSGLNIALNNNESALVISLACAYL